MRWSSPSFEVPHRLRAIVRARESSVIVLAAVAGVAAGLAVAAMGAVVALMHVDLFRPRPGRTAVRASIRSIRSTPFWCPASAAWCFGLVTAYVSRRRGSEVDPVEANALHGGRMSMRGSLIVAAQTMWSSGVGASVGLEAGYTQLASGIASKLGQAFRLRRSDMRMLVGCGAAARHCRGLRRAAWRRLLRLRTDHRQLCGRQPGAGRHGGADRLSDRAGLCARPARHRHRHGVEPCGA